MYFTYEPDPNNLDDYGMAITYRLVLNANEDEIPKVIKEPIIKTKDTIFWYGENKGFVSFGISHTYPTFHHKPGYMWSSRSSVFNGMFVKFDTFNLHRANALFREVLVKIHGEKFYGASAMTLEAIFDLLDEDKEIAIYKDVEDDEIRLEICDRKCSPNTIHFDRWTLIDTIAKV